MVQNITLTVELFLVNVLLQSNNDLFMYLIHLHSNPLQHYVSVNII